MGPVTENRRLAPLTPDECTVGQKALRAAIARAQPDMVAGDGSLVGPFDGWLREPRSGTATALLGRALRSEAVLPARVREIVILLVAAHERNPFEWYAHAPTAREAGWSADVLDAVRRGEVPVPDDAAARTACAAADELLRTGDLSDRAWAELLAAHGTAAAVELVTLVGYYRMVALQLRVLRVPVPDGAEPVVFG
jgi:4-carboxymuconolactone decarboxylase